MSELKIAEYARSLHIDLAEPTEESLRSAILSELMTLQRDDLSPEQVERRRALTDGFAQLRDGGLQKNPSTELVPINPNVIAEIVKAAVTAQNAGPSAEDKMRAGVQVATTRAKTDFRNGRTFPLAGIGVALSIAWSQRETFGVDLTSGGYAIWGAVSLTIVCMATFFYVMAYRARRSDERRLRRLYSPDIQALALRTTMDEPSFTLGGYRVALEQASQQFGHNSLTRLLSTVDIESAVDEASTLALERFVKLGVIEPVESITGAEYRPTAKYRAEHPIVPREDAAAEREAAP